MARWSIVSWEKLNKLSVEDREVLKKQWRGIIGKAKIDNFCLRYQGRLQNGYGIVWIKRKGLKGFSCRVHLVGMFLAGMKTPDFLHFQTSHICMKRNCIRTSHLVFETDIDNKKRIKCNRPPRSCQCNLTPKCFPRYTWNGTFQSQVRKDPTKKNTQEK